MHLVLDVVNAKVHETFSRRLTFSRTAFTNLNVLGEARTRSPTIKNTLGAVIEGFSLQSDKYLGGR